MRRFIIFRDGIPLYDMPTRADAEEMVMNCSWDDVENIKLLFPNIALTKQMYINASTLYRIAEIVAF